NVDEGTTYVWDVETKKEVASHDAGSQLLGCAVPNGEEVFLSTRKAIKAWRWRGDKGRPQFKSAKEGLGDSAVADLFFNSIASSPDGKRLFVGVQQLQPAAGGKATLMTQARILDGATGDVVHRFEKGDAHFDCWAFGRGV